MKFLKRFSKLSRFGLPKIEPAPDRHGMAIIAIVKNEADYLPEWIEFHRLVGVRGFYIYDNGSNDETVEVAKRHIGEDGLVIPFAGHFRDERLKRPVDMQTLSFAHAIANFGKDYRWFAFVDPDEFIVPKSSDNIVEILSTHLEAEVNISLPWHMFGPNGHKEKPDGLTIENYTTRYAGRIWPGTRYPFKLIVDPCEVSMISTHQAETWRDGGMSSNDVGYHVENKSRDDEFYSSEHLQLNHYFTRSIQELRERKLARGRVSKQGADYGDEKTKRAIEVIEQAAVQDISARALIKTLRKRVGY